MKVLENTNITIPKKKMSTCTVCRGIKYQKWGILPLLSATGKKEGLIFSVLIQPWKY